MNPLCFGDDRCAELQALGLVAEAISELESEALPGLRELLTRPPALNDIRGEVRTMGMALARAHRAVSAVLNAKKTAPHRYEARLLLTPGGAARPRGRELIELQQRLSEVGAHVDAVLKELPKAPTRHKSGGAAPIDLICTSMQRGFAMRGLALPAHLRPSASQARSFWHVVVTCYSAAGFPGADPERAIRAYMRDWRKLQRLSQAIAQGQNVKNVTDVLS